MKEYQLGQTNNNKEKSLTLESNISQCVLVLFYLGFFFFFGFSKIVNVFFKLASKKKGGKESYRGLNKKSTWSGEMLSG